MRQTSQKRFAFLAFVLVELLMKEQQTQNGEQKGSSADGGTITDILGTLNNLSAQTLKRLLSVTFVYKPPWKGRLTCPYPFIWVQMARGIHCVCESSLNSLVWPVISRPKAGRFGKMWVCHKKSPADLLRVTNPFEERFKAFIWTGSKGKFEAYLWQNQWIHIKREFKIIPRYLNLGAASLTMSKSHSRV